MFSFVEFISCFFYDDGLPYVLKLGGTSWKTNVGHFVDQVKSFKELFLLGSSSTYALFFSSDK
jgi:hypothetical protein